MHVHQWIEKAPSFGRWGVRSTRRMAGGLAALLILFLSGVAQAQFEYKVRSGKAIITRYVGSGGVVQIPSTLGGRRVAAIGKYAFAGDSSITQVIIPNGVTAIKNYAFMSCDRLTTVSIPASVSKIGFRAFVCCRKLSSFRVHSGNRTFYTHQGVLLNRRTSTLVSCPARKSGRYTIPLGITRIGDMAFGGCSRLTRIGIREGLTHIAGEAFVGCRKLTSISIPASAVRIGIAPFDGCSRLKSIRVATGNPAFSSASGVLFNKRKTSLIQCPAGKTGYYSIPDGVVRIGTGSFAGTRLLAVWIPDSVVSIRSYAFHYAARLSAVITGTGLASIGNKAFEYCRRLRKVYFWGNAPVLVGANVFNGSDRSTMYIAPGTVGWTPIFGGRPSTPFPNLTVSPSVQTVGATAGSTTVSAANTGGGTLKYKASETESWFSIPLGSSGGNSGTIVVAYDANPFTWARTGTVTIGSTLAVGSYQTVNIIQQEAPPPFSAAPASKSAAQTKAASKTARPLAWARSAGGEWTAAPELVDGDPGTLWRGQAGPSGWSIALDFGDDVPVENPELLYEDLPWLHVGRMGTRDLLDWFDLDPIDTWPVPCRSLYFDLPNPGSSTPPAIREILWEPESP